MKLRIDAAAGQVAFDAKVVRQEGYLEFFVCSGYSKAHETILTTEVLPSHVHAALLALGLTAGKPARWKEDPDSETAQFLPPKGAELKMTLKWLDKDGKPRQADASDWLAVRGGRGAAKPKAWVFVGSDVLPDGRYWADIDGELVSVSNFASAVIDVPFESSSQDEFWSFEADPKAVPPPETVVQVVLEPLPGAAKAAHARATLDIDALGRFYIEGRPITAGELAPWAENFIKDHSKGQVVIRSDSRATVWDIEKARGELRLGGVRIFDEERLQGEMEILPRTQQEASESLKTWADRFAHALDLIRDPAVEAQMVIDRVGVETEQVGERLKLWQRYSADLSKLLNGYKATTQPAGAAPQTREK